MFLLDDETGMRPNLRYAQAIPGLRDGRGIGTIDFAIFPEVLDAAVLLESSSACSQEIDREFRAWCTAYLAWLDDSEFGRDAQTRGNNISTYCDGQRVALCLYLGRPEEARRILEQAKERHIGAQVKPDGSQPLELARTNSYGYSCGNLRGLMLLARMGGYVDIDLWHYESPQGGSIRKALDFLAKYRDPASDWPYEQIKPAERERLDPMLRWAAKAYGDPKYAELADKYAK